MRITVTDYLDVVSSWCFWSEPTWAELKKRYDGRVEFQWKIALMDPAGLPIPIFLVLANSFLAYANWDKYKPLMEAK